LPSLLVHSQLRKLQEEFNERMRRADAAVTSSPLYPGSERASRHAVEGRKLDEATAALLASVSAALEAFEDRVAGCILRASEGDEL
jgi:hypothetical protein